MSLKYEPSSEPLHISTHFNLQLVDGRRLLELAGLLLED